MNRNYFNELNERLYAAKTRLTSLNEEIFGVSPEVDAVKDPACSPPALNLLADLALGNVNHIHDQISQLENAIKGT